MALIFAVTSATTSLLAAADYGVDPDLSGPFAGLAALSATLFVIFTIALRFTRNFISTD